MSSINKPRLVTGKKAGADLSSSQWKAVKQDANGDMVLCSVAKEKNLGFLHNAPIQDEFCEIAGLGGGSFAIAGGAINEGEELSVDVNGDLVPWTTPGYVVAIAMEDAADNDVFEVQPVLYHKV